MSKAMTREQMVGKALRMKRIMDFMYRHGLAGQKRAVSGVEDFILTRHGNVRVLKYGFEHEQVMPLYVDMHGGGFILMHADADETMNLAFSKGAGVKIVSVDYPKAPEFPYPIAIEAIHDVIDHFVSRAEEYRIDVTKMGIGGHSAGANMATVTCMRDLKTKEFNFRYQLLDYPPLDIATSPYDKPKPKGCIPPGQALRFNACYIDPENARDPSVSPVFARIDDLKGMPEALVIVCGADSLHDEGVKYAGMLERAGTKVDLHDYSTEVHGFTYYKPSANVAEAVRLMTEFIRINSRSLG